MNGAQALVRALVAHGVEVIFGVPGDTSMALYDALGSQDRIRHVLARDERTAGFMADAYARASGRPGVVEGPSGAGATYLLPALAEANDSSIAMIGINSDVKTTSQGTQALTELDQVSLFRPVTRWNCQVTDPARVSQLVSRAFREATAGRPGAVHLSLPEDVLSGPAGDVGPETAAPALFPARRFRPDPAALERAARLLSEARRPVIVAGGGAVASGAGEALAALATALGAPVVTSINGKGAVAESHPLAGGVVGGNGGKASSNRILAQSDLVLAVGTRLNGVTTDGGRLLDPAAGLIWLDVDPTMAGHNRPGTLALAGDARLALEELAGAVGGAPGGWGPEACQAAASEVAAATAAADQDAYPLDMMHVVASLRRLLPPDCICVVDAGTATPYMAAYYPAAAGRSCIFPRAHGGLGYAIGGVVGAALAAPGRLVVGLFGDGSLAMSMGELETVARLGERVLLLHLRNDTFAWIKIIQDIYHGGRHFGVDFGPADYAGVAAALGLQARAVGPGQDLKNQLEWALGLDGPAFLDVPVQSLVDYTPPVSRWQHDRALAPADRVRRSF